jgi:hypothetical protein
MIFFLSALAGGAILAAIALVILPLPDAPRAPPPPSPSLPSPSPPAPSHWPQSQRTTVIEICTQSCRNAPGVTAATNPVCDQVCACAADEAEKFLTANELAMIVMAEKAGMASSEQKEKMQRLKNASLACAQKLAR